MEIINIMTIDDTLIVRNFKYTHVYGYQFIFIDTVSEIQQKLIKL